MREEPYPQRGVTVGRKRGRPDVDVVADLQAVHATVTVDTQSRNEVGLVSHARETRAGGRGCTLATKNSRRERNKLGYTSTCRVMVRTSVQLKTPTTMPSTPMMGTALMPWSDIICSKPDTAYAVATQFLHKAGWGTGKEKLVGTDDKTNLDGSPHAVLDGHRDDGAVGVQAQGVHRLGGGLLHRGHVQQLAHLSQQARLRNDIGHRASCGSNPRTSTTQGQ